MTTHLALRWFPLTHAHLPLQRDASGPGNKTDSVSDQGSHGDVAFDDRSRLLSQCASCHLNGYR
eukprot:scaffold207081_cov30-Tisochrysis_lutea.AAC.2